MKTVQIQITSENKNDHSTVTVVLEKDRGAGWLQVNRRSVETNKTERVDFRLRQDERLIIEPYPPEAIAYDPTQAAAYKTASQEGESGIDDPRRRPSSAPTPPPATPRPPKVA